MGMSTGIENATVLHAPLTVGTPLRSRIDFEFACVGPVDLDVDCVGREVVGRAHPMAIDGLRGALSAVLDTVGATDRLRCYSLLRDLWAIGKWIQNDPSRIDAHAWAPVQDLIADVERSGWLDRLLH